MLTLPDPHAHGYYALFYLLGFGVAGFILLLQGWQQRYPWRPWLLLIAGTLLAFILGTKLIAWQASDWLYFFRTGAGPVDPARSVLGGLLLGTGALLALRKYFGFSWRVFDAFALALSFGLAVQGIGCLLAGCCFGVSTNGIGICYAPGSAAWAWQVARGELAMAAAQSLPVVPVQLYQILWCLAIGLLLLRRQASASRPPGADWLLALGLLLLGRFGLEFWRDPAGDVLGTGLWQGLKPVQWALLSSGILSFAVFGQFRQRPAQPRFDLPADLPYRNLALLILLLLGAAAIGPQTLTLPEILVIRGLLLPVMVLEAARLLHTAHLLRPLPLSLLALAGGLMSQYPSPLDSTQFKPAPYSTVSVAHLQGESHQLYGVQSSCNPSYPNLMSLPHYEQRYQATQLGWRRTWYRSPQNTVSLELNGSVGSVQNSPAFPDSIAQIYYNYGYDDPNSRANFSEYLEPRTLVRFNPYGEWYIAGTKVFSRVGVGFHVGRLAYDYVDQPGRARHFLPDLLFDLGFKRSVYFHFSTYRGFNGTANGMWQLGLGTQLFRSRVQLLGGLAVPNSDRRTNFQLDILGTSANFSAPQAYFGKVVVEPLPRLQLEATGFSNFNDVRQVNVLARYRLPSRR